MTAATEAPYLVALNLTRRCNLKCAHCYLDAGARDGGGPEELSTDEVKDLLNDIAALGDGIMVVLTGGEPLLRRDIEELARHATESGLMVVVGTNGILLDDDRVARLVDVGIKGVGISLDSLNAKYHDAFRGVPGAWRGTMAGIDACRCAGLALQLHFSVTDDNADELDDMIGFARSVDAMVLNVFFLVCTGRGEKLNNISCDTYEAVLRRVTQAAHDNDGLMVRAKCAPHFKRMAIELDSEWPITLAHGYDAGGCLAGTRYCRVTPEGVVTACPYIGVPVGSIRQQTFAEIWHKAPTFQALREPALEGRCGACEYRVLCGGCRARPLARDGNLMGEDFLCAYQPGGAAVIQPLRETAGGPHWTPEAESRLNHAPAFVRRMVRKRAEDYVRDQGRDKVTAEDLAALLRRRFGEDGVPPFLRDRNSARFGDGS